MFVDYSGFYTYDQMDSFIYFLAFLMAEFEEVLTTELHFVGISQHEYTGLSYNKLLSKMSKQTLLAAYDGNKECRASVLEYLNMLVQAFITSHVKSQILGYSSYNDIMTTFGVSFGVTFPAQSPEKYVSRRLG